MSRTDRISPLIKFTPTMLKQARHHWSRFIKAHEEGDDRYFRTYPSGFSATRTAPDGKYRTYDQEEGVEAFRVALRVLENSLTRYGKAAKVRLNALPIADLHPFLFALDCVFRHGSTGEAFRERCARGRAWIDRHPLLRLAEEVEVE